MRVVIFTKHDQTRAGILTTKAFLQSKHEVVAVFAREVPANLPPPVFQEFPTIHSLQKIKHFPVCQIENHNSIRVAEIVEHCHADLVVIAGDVILKPHIYARPRYGAINFHPGILPYYRGSHTIFHALRKRDLHGVGFTIHVVEETLDTGDIIYQEVIPVDKNDTVTSLIRSCEERAPPRLVDIASDIEYYKGKVEAFAQDLDRGITYKGRPSVEQEQDLKDLMTSSEWRTLINEMQR